jgi:hypothetical protein
VTVSASVEGSALAPHTISVRGVAPSIIGYGSSVASCKLQLAGSTVRSPPFGSPVSLKAVAWHVMYMPVLKSDGKPLVADPQLLASVDLVNSANASASVTGLRGYWSWTNGSYVIPISVPAAGSYQMTLSLSHPNDTGVTVGRVSPQPFDVHAHAARPAPDHPSARQHMLAAGQATQRLLAAARSTRFLLGPPRRG